MDGVRLRLAAGDIRLQTLATRLGSEGLAAAATTRTTTKVAPLEQQVAAGQRDPSRDWPTPVNTIKPLY